MTGTYTYLLSNENFIFELRLSRTDLNSIASELKKKKSLLPRNTIGVHEITIAFFETRLTRIAVSIQNRLARPRRLARE